MEDGRKGKKILSLWIFCAMIACVVLVPGVIFIIRQTVYFRLEQRKEQADFFTIAENISWRGFELFYGKNPTGYHFVQMDSVFFYESEYTKKEFSQFMEQNRIQKMNSEEVVLDYKHFLKEYQLKDPKLQFFQQAWSVSKVERPSVTIFVFWKWKGDFYEVKMVFFTL